MLTSLPAALAQSAERLTRNEQVWSSILQGGSTLQVIAPHPGDSCRRRRTLAGRTARLRSARALLGRVPPFSRHDPGRAEPVHVGVARPGSPSESRGIHLRRRTLPAGVLPTWLRRCYATFRDAGERLPGPGCARTARSPAPLCRGEMSRSRFLRSLLGDRRRAAEDLRIAEAYDAAAPAEPELAEASAVAAGETLHGLWDVARSGTSSSHLRRGGGHAGVLTRDVILERLQKRHRGVGDVHHPRCPHRGPDRRGLRPRPAVGRQLRQRDDRAEAVVRSPQGVGRSGGARRIAVHLT